MTEPTVKPGRPDRAGMKTMVLYLPQEVARRVKVIAAETDRTVQQIGEEAITNWLKTHELTATSGRRSG